MREDYLTKVSEFGGTYELKTNENELVNLKMEIDVGFRNLLHLASLTKMDHLKVKYFIP